MKVETKKKAMNTTAGMHQQDLPLLALIGSTKIQITYPNATTNKKAAFSIVTYTYKCTVVKKKRTMCYLTHMHNYKINYVFNIGTASTASRRLKILPNTL